MPLPDLVRKIVFKSCWIKRGKNKKPFQGEAMSPCTMIDEIDKGFGGDAEVMEELVKEFSSLLTWMAEKESAVFAIATNAIDSSAGY